MGEEFSLIETVEYVVLVGLAAVMILTMNNAVNTEKFNSVVADDIALTLDSVFIPDGNLVLKYDMGNFNRYINFEDGEVSTYIEDPIRERGSLILIDKNYVFDTSNTRTSFLEIGKKEDRIEVR